MPQWLQECSGARWDESALRTGETGRPMCNSISPRNLLTSADLREDPLHQFSCEASAIGLRPGHFPPTIETDAGNGQSLRIQHPVFGADGELLGVLYRQGDVGLEVLIQIG
jgi:hypothetical protein